MAADSTLNSGDLADVGARLTTLRDDDAAGRRVRTDHDPDRGALYFTAMTNTAKLKKFTIGACAIALVTVACATMRPPVSPEEHRLRLDPLAALRVMNTPAELDEHDDEAELSSRVRLALNESGALPIQPAGTAQSDRVRRLGRAVLRDWPLPLRGYDYTFETQVDPNPNAFAYGNGGVSITTGMLDILGDDDEVQAILAHEVAHNELRHIWRGQKAALKAIAVQGGLMALFHSTDSTAAAWAALVGNELVNAIYSDYNQDRESEADLLALHYLDHAGIGPRPFERAFSAMQREERRNSGLRSHAVYRTHPPTPERIRRAQTIRSRAIGDAGTAVGTDDQDYVRGGFQPLWVADHNGETDVVGVLSSPEYDVRRPVGGMVMTISGVRYEFSERTAENTDPGTAVPVIFRARQRPPSGASWSTAATASIALRGVTKWQRMPISLFSETGFAGTLPVDLATR